MARDYAGNQHHLNPAGEITGIGNAEHAIMVWTKNSSVTAGEWLVGTVTNTQGASRRRMGVEPPTASGMKFSYRVPASTVHWWNTQDDYAANVWHSYVVSYDASNVTVDPDMYVDNASVNVIKVEGNGSRTTGDDRVKIGENNSGGSDLTGQIGAVAIVSRRVDSGEVNRFHWWGASPGGPSTMLVWLPMWTDKLANSGSASTTFAASASAPTMTTIPKIERCWAASMGVGR